MDAMKSGTASATNEALIETLLNKDAATIAATHHSMHTGQATRTDSAEALTGPGICVQEEKPPSTAEPESSQRTKDVALTFGDRNVDKAGTVTATTSTSSTFSNESNPHSHPHLHYVSQNEFQQLDSNLFIQPHQQRQQVSYSGKFSGGQSTTLIQEQGLNQECSCTSGPRGHFGQQTGEDEELGGADRVISTGSPHHSRLPLQPSESRQRRRSSLQSVLTVSSTHTSISSTLKEGGASGTPALMEESIAAHAPAAHHHNKDQYHGHHNNETVDSGQFAGHIWESSWCDVHDSDEAVNHEATFSSSASSFSSSISFSPTTSPRSESQWQRTFSQQQETSFSWVDDVVIDSDHFQPQPQDYYPQLRRLRRSSSLPSIHLYARSLSRSISVNSSYAPRSTEVRGRRASTAQEAEHQLTQEKIAEAGEDGASVSSNALHNITVLNPNPAGSKQNSFMRPWAQFLAVDTSRTTSPSKLDSSSPPLQVSMTRPRRKSMLSLRQLETMSQQDGAQSLEAKDGIFGKKGGFGYLGQKKDKHSKQQTADRSKGASSNQSAQCNASKCSQPQDRQRPSPKAPFISFLPHHTEISTDQPSVSGRLILHIPRLQGKKFHFVSLALHLRLKESISWKRQDLVSFVIEKHHWAQTVWDKKVMLNFQDRQVEEGGEDRFRAVTGNFKGLSPAAAIVAAASAAAASSAPTDHEKPQLSNSNQRQFSIVADNNSELNTTTGESLSRTLSSPNNLQDPVDATAGAAGRPVIDEWCWEWLLPVTRYEVRPESFEGSMGMVWYELEAKCLFRWDKIDKDGNVIPDGDVRSMAQCMGGLSKPKSGSRNGQGSKDKTHLGSTKLLKGLGASTNTAKSIVNVFGKLRVGNKSKKSQHVDDFNLGTQHEEYFNHSLKRVQEVAAAAMATQAAANQAGPHTLSPLQNLAHEDDIKSPYGAMGSLSAILVNEGRKATENTRTDNTLSIPEPVPFLIRKTLKLHFNRPPAKASSNAAFFLPAPSMSLPTLPSTRRLKAIIPGARIQVQIQVPSIIPIPGYALTTQLTPNSKTNGLVPIKGSAGELDATTGKCFGDQYLGYYVGSDAKKKNRSFNQLDSRYPDSFQAALTIRKVTKHDINRSQILKRRYENTELPASTSSKHVDGNSVFSTQCLSGSTPKWMQSLESSAQSSGPIILTAGTGTGDRQRSDSVGGLVGATVSSTTDRAGDTGLSRTYEGDNAVTKTPSGKKGWRKEIRVRKVKCEFWQKETCRIPTDDAPSRSIKIPMGPAFTYLEKKQEKERQRHAAAQHYTTSSWDAHGPAGYDGQHLSLQPTGLNLTMTGFQKDDSLSTSLSPGQQSAGDLKQPLRAGLRKASFGSIITPSSLLHSQSPTVPQAHPNQPFMLLIPVPLDSPKLRQTYAWPSSQTPSPIRSSGFEYSMPRGTATESGLGSELDCQSHPTLYEFVGTSGRTGGADGLGGGFTNTMASNAPPVKARIEVKHYLSFRLSIDILEYEGELEPEEVDMEAIEEHQLQQAKDHHFSGLTTPATPTASTFFTGFPLGYESRQRVLCYSPTSPTGFADNRRYEQSSLPCVSGTTTRTGITSSKAGAGIAPSSIVGLTSSISSGYLGTGVNAGTATGMPVIQPALISLNTGAGLQGMDKADLDRTASSIDGDLSLFGMSYNQTQRRRGSEDSLGTTNSGVSSVQAGKSPSAYLSVQTSSSVSGASNDSRHVSSVSGASNGSSIGSPVLNMSSVGGTEGFTHGGGASTSGIGGLMAGAIGALKKKASSSAFANTDGSSPQQQQQQPKHASQSTSRGCVSVQKLKDFVIRVPITIVIQVDERGNVTEAYGTTESNNRINSSDNINGNSNFNGDDRQGMMVDTNTRVHSTQQGGLRLPPTTTVTNIVTRSSNSMSGSVGPYDSTETFSSMNSVAASVGSESIKQRMDDLQAHSSLLHIAAGLKHRPTLGPGGHEGILGLSSLAALQNHQRMQQQHQSGHGHVSYHRSTDLTLESFTTLNPSGMSARKDDTEEDDEVIVVTADEMDEEDMQNMRY
ncbi:hypothetical protein BGZ51_004991 [Haplosporangium sp. Z 767]|nr:hypothetical protein BGZ51_004991 [Haplosporangium sp. Z 767]